MIGFKINFFVFKVVEIIVPYKRRQIRETQKKNSGIKKKFSNNKIISF